MNLANLLHDQNVVLEMNEGDAQGAITAVVDHLISKQLLVSALRDEMLGALLAREDQVSTGIGSGVAIPHAFSSSIDEAVAVFARSTSGVEFESLDNAPVHFMILFLVPEKDRNTHLQILAAIAKMFKTCGMREQLMAAQSAAGIVAVLQACTA